MALVLAVLEIAILPVRAALSDGLVFYASYDGTADNTVLGQEPASFTGNTLLTNAGRFGSGGLWVNESAGQDAGVQYTDSYNNFDLGSGDFSAGAWVFLPNVTNRQQIITMNRTGTATDLQVWVENGYLKVDFFGSGDPLSMQVLLRPEDWESKWMHVAFVCRRLEGGWLYVNGEFRGALKKWWAVGAYSFATTSVSVGYHGSSISGWSLQNALVDEVALWIRAVSSEEINILQESPLVQGDSGLWVRLGSKKPILNQVDILERVYPDRAPAKDASTFNVARGGNAFFQFALTAGDVLAGETLSFSLDTLETSGGLPLAGTGTVHVLSSVMVEANSAGCSTTEVGVYPLAGALDTLVRTAPFEVYEVLSNDTVLAPDGRAFYSVVVRIRVDTNAVPGVYHGTLNATSGTSTVASVSFETEVFPSVLSGQKVLNATHWLSPEPADLTTGTVPAWWSEEHWTLLEEAGEVLRDYGDTSMFMPLIFGGNPLVPINLTWSGRTFDFTNFNRWVSTFSGIGFTQFQGIHIGGGGTPSPASSSASSPRAVWETNPFEQSYLIGTTEAEWMGDVLPDFYDSLYSNLTANGWQDLYVQSLCDEPLEGSVSEYAELLSLTTNHMPGIKIMEAVNQVYPTYGEQMDIPAFWFGKAYVSDWPNYLTNRVQQGKTNWIYNACSPLAPHPNRHLDYPLACSRLFPWLADYCKATGYLNWAANIYRGANPYLTSIGPLPDGSQDPGHPPGDNWFFYKTDGGMLPSMRMAAFLMGKEDFELLSMLRQTSPAAADAIANGIAQEVILDYSADNVRSFYAGAGKSYHHARLLLLEAL